ncbi:MAG TPA: Grx4 family monothiol glutaredoxin [Bdellovibrionota bacterium]|nr:Grx4 family monothiol glutaredoxin [Bdellovibrionota bacterium]
MTREEALKLIEDTIRGNDVVLFMKGTSDFPMCGFSGQTSQILKHFGLKFKDINILEDETLRNTIKEYSNWPTIPQLYLKGEFIGGADITREMALSGELEKVLREKSLIS